MRLRTWRMATLVAGVAASCLFFGEAATSAETLELEAGTPVTFAFDQTLTTSPNKKKARKNGKRIVTEGDLLRAVVLDPVVIGGQTLIKQGAPVIVEVRQAKRGRMAGRKGLLDLDVKTVLAVDGSLIPLDTNFGSTGANKVGSTVALTYLTGGFGLLRRGSAAEVPANTPLTAFTLIEAAVEVEGEE